MSSQDLEKQYHQVVALYDLADELICSVADSHLANREAHYHAVKPVVDQIEESADALTEIFIDIAETSGAAAPTHRARIEMAFRKIYAVADECMQDLSKSKKQTLESIGKAVNPILGKIKRQLEKVITVFVGYVELALDRIMQKNDLDRLKQHEVTIANLLHQMSANHGKTT